MLAGAAWLLFMRQPDSNGTPPAAVAQTSPAATPAPLAAKATEARDFIIAQTTGYFRERGASGKLDTIVWGIKFQSLSDGWVWSETMTNMGGSPYYMTVSMERIEYAVDPKTIGLPVVVQDRNDGGASIKLECRLAKCISAIGSLNHATGAPKTLNSDALEETPVNEQRVSNYWFYEDRETAERVAAAMNTLLEAQGAQKKAF